MKNHHNLNWYLMCTNFGKTLPWFEVESVDTCMYIEYGVDTGLPR